MKKIKQRILAMFLSVTMILASVNLTNFFNKNISGAITDESGTTAFSYTGKTETYTVEKTGYYLIECAGGKGGDISINYYGGKGGYTKAKVYLEKGTTLYVNVGSAGANWGSVFEIHYDTYGGGAQGKGKSADGGGSTDIRINDNNIDSRFIVSGGGGAASWGYNGLNGGAANSGNNNISYYGSAATNAGGGGGGGWVGGTAGANNSTAARGGSNYFNTNYGTLISNTAGYNDNSGFASITYIANYSVAINPNGGYIDNSTDNLYYSKTGSSGTTISTTFNYTGYTQTYTVPKDGVYKLETYGASGGGNSQAYGSHKGLGGYSSGYVYLKEGTILYVNIGQQGSTSKSMSWNGGGAACAYHADSHSGGGATDISLYGTSGTTSWNTKEHLYSRLIVAGGGGGSDNTSGEANGTADDGSGGHGGGTTGGYGRKEGSTSGGAIPGTQTSGYAFGYGAIGGNVQNHNDAGGGGGGWYGGNGGYSTSYPNNSGGAGGSGYVYTESTASYYPSGCLLTSDYFLSGTTMSTGVREGNGYAVISYSDNLILKTPTRSGYTFNGWKITAGNGSITNGIFTYAEGETVVEAQWTKNVTASTLTINPNGGIYEDNKENTIISSNSGTTTIIAIPERDNYRFTGWTKTGGGSLSGNTFTFNTTDATLTANWELITASLTIKPNTGLYNGSTKDVYEDGLTSGDIKNISAPTKKGHTFKEWQITGTGAYFDNKGFHMGATDIILTAQYDINKYNVKINPNTGKWNSTGDVSTFTMDWNSTKSIPVPEAPAGMVFSGWSLEGEEAVMTSLTEASTLTMGISDVELVANYETDIFDIEGTVTWVDDNDSLKIKPQEVTIELWRNGTLLSSKAPDKDGKFSFIDLDRCDSNQEFYKYELKQVFENPKVMTWNTSTKKYESIDAYKSSLTGYNFTNTLVDIEEKPVIIVKPDCNNSLTFKLDYNNVDWDYIERTSQKTEIMVTLKQLENIVKDNQITYSSNYNGMEYNAIVGHNGITINNLPAGKFEIITSNDNTFDLNNIKVTTTNSITITKENGEWYLTISESSENQTGTVTFTHTEESLYGYESTNNNKGYYSSK